MQTVQHSVKPSFDVCQFSFIYWSTQLDDFSDVLAAAVVRCPIFVPLSINAFWTVFLSPLSLSIVLSTLFSDFLWSTQGQAPVYKTMPSSCSKTWNFSVSSPSRTLTHRSWIFRMSADRTQRIRNPQSVWNRFPGV